VKLYTYTAERSLPRLATEGLPEDSALDHPNMLESLVDSMYGEEEPGPHVMLEVDVTGLQDRLMVDGEWGNSLIESGDAKEEDFFEWTDLEKTAAVAGYMVTAEPIPPGRVKVLGQLRPDFDDLEGVDFEMPPDELFKLILAGKPKPLKAFKQPLVTRLLRSIFLPKHGLYGTGERVVMGMRLVEVRS
jgi:hypothetical protein